MIESPTPSALVSAAHLSPTVPLLGSDVGKDEMGTAWLRIGKLRLAIAADGNLYHWSQAEEVSEPDDIAEHWQTFDWDHGTTGDAREALRAFAAAAVKALA